MCTADMDRSHLLLLVQLPSLFQVLLAADLLPSAKKPAVVMLPTQPICSQDQALPKNHKNLLFYIVHL